MVDIVVGLLIVGPAVLTYFLRSNGAVVFLAVCAGYVAAQLSGNEVADSLSGTNFKVRNTDIDLLLLFLPMAFSVFITARAANAQLKIVLNTAAAALAGALFVLAAAPFMAVSLHINLNDSKIWSGISSAQSFVAGAGALYSLLLLWFFSSRHSGKKHK